MRNNKSQNIFILEIIIAIVFFLPQKQIQAQNSGTAYCGPYNISSPILLKGVSDTIIYGLEISNPNGNCISLENCRNIIIEKCRLRTSSGNGIDLYQCDSIIVTECRIDSVATGVYALESTKIQVLNVSVENVVGPFPRGQMVQFNKVYGEGNKINYNVAENILGESYPEDIISIYESHGTENDPIQVIGNWIRGGGPSSSGGGIMTGDYGGSNIIVKNNILVNPGQYGIAIAGGNNIKLLNNKIYSKQQSFTNVGLYVWNQQTFPCGSHTVSGNIINWTNRDGINNACWNANNCDTIIGWDDNSWNANIDSTILQKHSLVIRTGIDRQLACDSFIWIDGNTYTSSNNTASYTLTNSNGCDSIVTLDLTISSSNRGTDVITTCDSITWIDGNNYTSNNNTATHTLINSNGCDSLVILDLTIEDINNNITVNGRSIMSDEESAEYQWLDCGNEMGIINGETSRNYSPVVSGSYAVQLTKNGCVDTSICKVITLTNVKKSFVGRFTYYQTYTNNNLIIEFDDILKKFKVQLFNISGQFIEQQNFENTNRILIETSTLKGCFFVKIIDSSESFAVVKLIR